MSSYFIRSNNSNLVAHNEMDTFAQATNAIFIMRSQRVKSQLAQIGLPPEEFMTPGEQQQMDRGVRFNDEIEELATDIEQAQQLKLAVNRYLSYVVATVQDTSMDDFAFLNPTKEIIAENRETIAAQAQALKNMRSQIKAQDTANTALEEMQRRERGLMLEMEAMKTRLADMEKEKTKIQNTLAKTTIALEKSQDLLRKNTEHRLKNLANNFCKKGNK